MKYLILLLAIVTYVNAEKYCKLESCLKKGEHTLCKYTAENKCENLISTGLTDEEKVRIVKKHNELRQKVARGEETRGHPGPQPAATSMQDLVWDEEIAFFAQHTADQCFGAQISDDCRDTEKEEINQVVAVNTTYGDISSLTVEKLIQDMYDDVDNFDSNQVNKPYESEYGYRSYYIGGYTQIVWAKTNKVGCGIVKNYVTIGFQKISQATLVCNYGPAGNVVGEKMYEIASSNKSISNASNPK